MKIGSFTNRKKLLQRIKKEKSSHSIIIKLLELKKKPPISLNPRLIENTKIKSPERKLAYEGLKIIDEAGNSLNINKSKYKKQEEENQLFLKHFRTYKTIKNKNTFKAVQKKEFAFGNLLQTYQDKGITFQDFFNKDILKQSGITLRRKNLIEDYYSDEVRKGGAKSRKIIKYKNFLSKLSVENKKCLIRRLPFQNATQIKELEDKIKIDKDFLLGEEQTIQKEKEEIEKLLSQNERLTNLIEVDKKNFEHLYKIHDYNKNIFDNDDDNNSSEINNIRSYSHLGDEKNNNEIKLSLKEISEEDIKKDLNQPQNYKSIFANDNDNEIENKNDISKMESLNFTRRTKKLSTTLPSISVSRNRIQKKVTFHESGKNLDLNARTVENKLLKFRLRKQNTLREDDNINKIVIPNLLEKIKNKRKINAKNISISSTDRTIMKSVIKKNNSQPNIFSVKDTYEKLNECNKKIYQEENIKKILENFYGKKITDVNAKNVGIKFYNLLYSLKGKLYQKGLKDYIYIKYKDILSKEFKQKISISKSLTEKIRNRANYFVEKYTEQFNKLNQKNKN